MITVTCDTEKERTNMVRALSTSNSCCFLFDADVRCSHDKCGSCYNCVMDNIDFKLKEEKGENNDNDTL